MLPPDGYIYMYMSQVFKNILHFLLCHIFGLNNSYHDLWSDPLKKHEEYSDQSAINSCSWKTVLHRASYHIQETEENIIMYSQQGRWCCWNGKKLHNAE